MSSGLSSKSALRWTTLILCAVALYVSWPLWPALVLAAWTATIAHPLVERLERGLNGRRRAAGVLVFLLFLSIAIPLALIGVSVVVGAQDLLDTLAASPTAIRALEWIAVGANGDATAARSPGPADLAALVRHYGAAGFDVLTDIAGAAARGLLVVLVYFTAAFMFILEGRSEWSWVRRHAPLRPEHLDRLMAAFQETGRGLLVGVGLTTATQGAAATIAYVALGVPQAWVLGPITGLASVVPVVGSALIWLPIAAGFVLTGHPVKAALLTVVGVGVISIIDNVLHPMFARMAALRMPLLLLLVSLLGGVMTLGTWGAVIGPLVVRLAMEALAIIRDDDGDVPTEPSAG
jgi:predicted PurR-regulated permease PerM